MSRYKTLSHVIYKCDYLGIDEEKIIRYVKYQEKEEKQVGNQQQSFDF
ncbi:MAG: hypothetical protein AAF804_16255 [Bacteroidota bacterium]